MIAEAAEKDLQLKVPGLANRYVLKTLLLQIGASSFALLFERQKRWNNKNANAEDSLHGSNFELLHGRPMACSLAWHGPHVWNGDQCCQPWCVLHAAEKLAA